jgi:DNA-binding GntR family transcriptional regulator
LEGLATYFAAENATHDELNQIENFLGQAQLAIKYNDISALNEAYGGFHSSIRNASHSTFLVNQISTYQSSANCIRHDEQNSCKNLHIIYNEHVAIFQALKDRNGPLTEQRMVDHIRNSTTT